MISFAIAMKMDSVPNSLETMREFMELVNIYSQTDYESPLEVLEENIAQIQTEHPIFSDLRNIAFKMRSIMESDQEPNYIMGFDNAMQRAADMIDNLVNRYIELEQDIG